MTDQGIAARTRTRSNDLAIRVNLGVNLGIHRTVFEALDCPTNLHFWWGDREKVLAISATDEPTELSVSIPNYFHRHGSGCRLKLTGLRKAIQQRTGWKDGTIKNLNGEYVPELKMVIFKTGDVETEGRYGQE